MHKPRLAASLRRPAVPSHASYFSVRPARLQALQLEKYADAFEREEVEVAYLNTLSDLDLQTLGVHDAGVQSSLRVSTATRRGAATAGALQLLKT